MKFSDLCCIYTWNKFSYRPCKDKPNAQPNSKVLFFFVDNLAKRVKVYLSPLQCTYIFRPVANGTQKSKFTNEPKGVLWFCI